MKIRRILENSSSNKELPIYNKDIMSFDSWLTIKNSGKFNPNSIHCNFYTKNENLKTLEGSPESVLGIFTCTHNLLENLIGGPKWVNDTLDYDYNRLTSLEGGPEFAGGNVFLTNNKLESLANIHKHFKTINKMLYISFNPIKSNILGILLIKSLSGLYIDGAPFNILRKHLKGDKDVLECQEEMISAGYKEFARL